MEPVQRLAAIEEIHQLKARYFRCIDTKDWEGLRALFLEDAAFDLTDDAPDPSSGIVHGRDQFVNTVSTRLAEVASVHHGCMPEITIVSEHTAEGVWAMDDDLRWPEGSPIRRLRGAGHYHETYRKVDGHWRIATMRLTRLSRDIETA
jgi:hypothetical protein